MVCEVYVVLDCNLSPKSDDLILAIILVIQVLMYVLSCPKCSYIPVGDLRSRLTLLQYVYIYYKAATSDILCCLLVTFFADL